VSCFLPAFLPRPSSQAIAPLPTCNQLLSTARVVCLPELPICLGARACMACSLPSIAAFCRGPVPVRPPLAHANTLAPAALSYADVGSFAGDYRNSSSAVFELPSGGSLRAGVRSSPSKPLETESTVSSALESKGSTARSRFMMFSLRRFASESRGTGRVNVAISGTS